MLLDVHKVLDKGEVALISCSNDGKMLRDIQETYLRSTFSRDLMKIANATMMIKCPLFVQLNLSKFDLRIINVQQDKIEVYIPDISEITAKTLQDKNRIYKYFDQTMTALTLNAKGLPMDGCDPFIAQTTMPVATYSKLIVHGCLSTWTEFLMQRKLPSPVEAYRVIIKNILSAHWTNIR